MSTIKNVPVVPHFLLVFFWGLMRFSQVPGRIRFLTKTAFGRSTFGAFGNKSHDFTKHQHKYIFRSFPFRTRQYFKPYFLTLSAKKAALSAVRQLKYYYFLLLINDLTDFLHSEAVRLRMLSYNRAHQLAWQPLH